MKGDHGRVIAVFQPHLFSRTRYLQREFGQALTLADEAIVTEIFPAREEPEPGVSGKLIVDAYLAERPGGPVSFLPRLSDVVARPRAARAARRPRAHAGRRRRVPRRRAAARHARGARGRGRRRRIVRGTVAPPTEGRRHDEGTAGEPPAIPSATHRAAHAGHPRVPTAVYAWGRSSSSFDIAHVARGRHASRAREARAAPAAPGLPRPQPLHRHRRRRAQDARAALLRRRARRVDRDFPETLRVTLTEYEPAAYALAGDRWYVLDRRRPRDLHGGGGRRPARAASAAAAGASASPSPRRGGRGHRDRRRGRDAAGRRRRPARRLRAERLVAGPAQAPLPLPRLAVAGRVARGASLTDKAARRDARRDRRPCRASLRASWPRCRTTTASSPCASPAAP